MRRPNFTAFHVHGVMVHVLSFKWLIYIPIGGRIQLFQLRLSRRKGKKSNMSAKGLSRKTSFIPEYITIHRFSTKFKIRSCFLMNINRDYVSLKTKFCSVCVFLIVTPSKLFALVFDFSALLGDNLN